MEQVFIMKGLFNKDVSNCLMHTAAVSSFEGAFSDTASCLSITSSLL